MVRQTVKKDESFGLLYLQNWEDTTQDKIKNYLNK